MTDFRNNRYFCKEQTAPGKWGYDRIIHCESLLEHTLVRLPSGFVHGRWSLFSNRIQPLHARLQHFLW